MSQFRHNYNCKDYGVCIKQAYSFTSGEYDLYDLYPHFSVFKHEDLFLILEVNISRYSMHK